MGGVVQVAGGRRGWTCVTLAAETIAVVQVDQQFNEMEDRQQADAVLHRQLCAARAVLPSYAQRRHICIYMNIR